MKHLKNLSRIAVFATSIIWLMTRASVVYAQLQECYTYNAEEGNPCDTCCNGGSDEQGVSDGTITGPGIQILSSMFEYCGSSASCPGPNPNGYCGTQSWLQAVDDPVDCCLPSGSPCNQGTCCSGLICLSNNTCGACIGGGGACGANSDCCSSVCCNGTCTNNTCSCPDTALCDDYTLSQLTTACTRKADVPPAITGSELLIPGFLIESPRFSWNWPSFSLKESYVTLSYPTAYPVATRVRNLCGYPEIGARFAERCARWPGNNSLTGDNPCGKNNPYHPGVVHGTTSFPQKDRQDRTPFAPLSWPDFQKAHRAAIPPISTGRPDRESRAPIA